MSGGRLSRPTTCLPSRSAEVRAHVRTTGGRHRDRNRRPGRRDDLAAVIGKQALGRTDRALRQTHDELKLSRSEVEQTHRPVITPLNDETSAALAGVGSRPLKPNVIAGRLFAPITNIGSGPALDVEVEVEVRLPDGSYGQTSGWPASASANRCLSDPAGGWNGCRVLPLRRATATSATTPGSRAPPLSQTSAPD